MTDTTSFDLTLGKWPSDFAGQSLFVSGPDMHNTAVLGWSHAPMDIYAASYKGAADALAVDLVTRQAPLDSAIYPLVYLYRQGLELQLKMILPLARRVASKPEATDHEHRLLPLWKELRSLVAQIDPIDARKDHDAPAVEQFLKEFEQVDPLSFSFRYPTDKKGQVTLPNLTHINVRHLSDVMDSIFMYLNGTNDWLASFDQRDY